MILLQAVDRRSGMFTASCHHGLFVFSLLKLSSTMHTGSTCKPFCLLYTVCLELCIHADAFIHCPKSGAKGYIQKIEEFVCTAVLLRVLWQAHRLSTGAATNHHARTVCMHSSTEHAGSRSTEHAGSSNFLVHLQACLLPIHMPLMHGNHPCIS